jgi:hypothetical protein
MRSPPTMEPLQALNRTARAAAWIAPEQEAAIAPLGCDERCARLGQAEGLARENACLKRTRRAAQQPRRPAGIEALDSSRRQADARQPEIARPRQTRRLRHVADYATDCRAQVAANGCFINGDKVRASP